MFENAPCKGCVEHRCFTCIQSQLEETHKLLHEEHRKRFRLEDDNTRMGMEVARIKDLEALLNKERCVHACDVMY
jgi:formate dehydrogenase assembly factor FdhD